MFGDSSPVTALVSRAARHRPWPSRAVIGVGSGAAVLGICAGGCALVAANVAAGAPAEDGPVFWPILLVGAVSYAVVGAWLVARRTAGLLGPVFLGVALSLAAALTTRAYGVHGLQVVDGLPGDRWAFWVAAWVWVPGLLSLLTVVPHGVPDGALASGRWRPALAVSVVAVTVAR
ncbi:hypothetical protein EV383_2357 [Pseudonocardia sediminis]|uniref:Uncharacterized protein n=1 Tax=Pseudonocardia sediminis TaxID=1397368 RepID=A0A4V2FQS1_PSEST|nr:hypothetical protein EV383_2357 [Pseudonocardia sediminis]